MRLSTLTLSQLAFPHSIPQAELSAASRLFLKEIKDAVASRKDFAFETTLSGRSYLKLVSQLLSGGWQVELIYLSLPSVQLSKLRVAERVAHGGHDVAKPDLERRFPRSLRNLIHNFFHLASRIRCFQNSGKSPSLVFEQTGE